MGNPLSLPDDISQNMELAAYLADTEQKAFSEDTGHPEPLKITILKKCLKLLRIYGTSDRHLVKKSVGFIKSGKLINGSSS